MEYVACLSVKYCPVKCIVFGGGGGGGELDPFGGWDPWLGVKLSLCPPPPHPMKP